MIEHSDALFLNSETLFFSRNQIIEKIHQKPKGVYLIKSGSVKQLIIVGDKIHLRGVLPPKTIFGHPSIANQTNSFTYKCFTDVEIKLLLSSNLTSLAEQQRLMLFNDGLYKENKLLIQKIMVLQNFSIDQRIIFFLSELHEMTEGRPVKVTRREVAEYAGCSVEYAFRTISKLKKNGILYMKDNLLKVHVEKAMTSFNQKDLKLIKQLTSINHDREH